MIMMEKQANVNFNFNFYGQYAWNQIYIHVAIYHTHKKNITRTSTDWKGLKFQQFWINSFHTNVDKFMN